MNYGPWLYFTTLSWQPVQRQNTMSAEKKLGSTDGELINYPLYKPSRIR